MRRLLLAIGVCAFTGLLGGLGYAALTSPPFTARAQILLPSGAPVPGLGQAGVQRLTDRVVSVSAQGKTPAEAATAASAAVRGYLTRARASRAQLLDQVTVVPQHQGGRLPALAALGALVGALAGTLGALTARTTYRP
jgi:LPS O-antigen subunit length determinant protein (WzzB/FepE family)